MKWFRSKKTTKEEPRTNTSIVSSQQTKKSHDNVDYSHMMPSIIMDFEKSIASIIFICIDSLEFGLGTNKLVQVLTGKQTKFITDYELHHNPAYSLLRPFSGNDLKEVIEILEITEYIKRTVIRQDIYILSLTEKAYAFLAGEEELEVSFIDSLSKNDFIELNEEQDTLYERLRKERYLLAQSNNNPAYVICGDRVLRQIAADCPLTQSELLEIKGIGQAFIEKYSDEFLEITNSYIEQDKYIEQPLHETINEIEKLGTDNDSKSFTEEEVVSEDNRGDDSKPIETCKNCMLYRAEECIGEKTICEFYKSAPDIPDWEIEMWPKEMSGAYGTLHKDW